MYLWTLTGYSYAYVGYLIMARPIDWGSTTGLWDLRWTRFERTILYEVYRNKETERKDLYVNHRIMYIK